MGISPQAFKTCDLDHEIACEVELIQEFTAFQPFNFGNEIQCNVEISKFLEFMEVFLD